MPENCNGVACAGATMAVIFGLQVRAFRPNGNRRQHPSSNRTRHALGFLRWRTNSIQLMRQATTGIFAGFFIGTSKFYQCKFDNDDK
jgi:hypothetical protein